MSANRQWKVVDERYSGNVFTDDHWYSTHIPRIVRVRTTQTTQKYENSAILRKLLREAEFWAAQNLESRKAPIRRT